MLSKIVTATVFLCAPWLSYAQSALDPGMLYKQASPAVVLIETLGNDGKPAKGGSGLLVSSDGKLLTNGETGGRRRLRYRRRDRD